MLTRLLPDQISKLWDIIGYAVEQSLPPIAGDHPDKMNRILASALSGKVDVWVSYVREEKVNKFEGIVLTKFIYDDASGTKNLLIYCLYGYNEISKESWVFGLKGLVKYAESKGCSQIIAYSEVPYIIDIVNRLGGDSRYRFISFDVKKIVEKINNLSEA